LNLLMWPLRQAFMVLSLPPSGHFVAYAKSHGAGS